MKKISCSIVVLAAAVFFGLGAQQTAMAIGSGAHEQAKTVATDVGTAKGVKSLVHTEAVAHAETAIETKSGKSTTPPTITHPGAAVVHVVRTQGTDPIATKAQNTANRILTGKDKKVATKERIEEGAADR